MFKISPINDVNLQKEYASQCDTTLKDGYFAYAMIDVDTNELMGFSQFDIEASGAYISDLKPRVGLSDFEAMFILGRATMNFIDLCGKHTCIALKNSGDERLLKAIGFKKTDDDNWFADMTGMFDGHCGGHTVETTK